MKSFENCVAAITGAGSGIGRYLAKELAARGCHLALSDVNAENLEQLASELSSQAIKCTTHVVDVADRSRVEQFASETVEAHGRVHMIFNNAGVALADYVETQSYEDFEWLMKINFWGVVYGTRSFLPLLRKVDDAHVINISSVFGMGAVPTQSAYNAAKFAVRGFTESLKMELADSHINVSCVHPGGISTNIVNAGRISTENMDMSHDELKERFKKQARTTPEEAARIILKGVKKNKRRILVGKDAWVWDKIVRLFPTRYEKILGLEKPPKDRW